MRGESHRRREPQAQSYGTEHSKAPGYRKACDEKASPLRKITNESDRTESYVPLTAGGVFEFCQLGLETGVVGVRGNERPFHFDGALRVTALIVHLSERVGDVGIVRS